MHLREQEEEENFVMQKNLNGALWGIFLSKKKRIGIAGDATELFDGDLRKIL